MTDIKGAPVKVLIERLPWCPEHQVEYATEGASGLDLRAGWEGVKTTPRILCPGSRLVVGTGIRVAVPRGWEFQIRSRSGWARDYGLVVLNSPGTVDSDYRGEVMVLLAATGSKAVRIAYGDRIAQGVFAPVCRVEFSEEPLDQTIRNMSGFGSTGIS